MRKNYKNVSEVKKKLSGTNFFFFGKVVSTNNYLWAKNGKGPIYVLSLKSFLLLCRYEIYKI